MVGKFNLRRTEGTCTVYADVDTVLSTFGYNEVNVMLQSPSAFDELVDAIDADPSLQIRAEREATGSCPRLELLAFLLPSRSALREPGSATVPHPIALTGWADRADSARGLNRSRGRGSFGRGMPRCELFGFVP